MGLAAYILTKRSVDNTGHISGEMPAGRRQRLSVRLEEQPAEAPRALARQLTIVLEPERARIERALETTITSVATDKDHADPLDTIITSPAQASVHRPSIAPSPIRDDSLQPMQAMDIWNGERSILFH